MVDFSKYKNDLSIRTIIYLVCKVSSQAISFLSNIIFVRLLTTNDYGIVSLYLTVINILQVIVGLRLDGIILMAKNKYGDDKLDEYSSSALSLSALWMLLIVIIYNLFFRNIVKKIDLSTGLINIAIFHSFAKYCLNYRSAYFTAKREPIRDFIISIGNSILSLALSILGVLSLEHDVYLGRILGDAIANIVMAVIILSLIFQKGKVFINYEYWKYSLILSYPLILSGLSSIILSSTDSIMLKQMLGNESVGIYSFAFKLALPISVIQSAFSQSWNTEYFEYYKNNRTDDIISHSKVYLINYSIITGAYLLASKELLFFVGTIDYYIAKNELMIMIIYYYMFALQSFPINYEFVNNKTKIVGIGFFVTCIINIALNWILIEKSGMLGAAVASLLSMIILFLIHDFFARYIIRNYMFKGSFYLNGLKIIIPIWTLTCLFEKMPIIRWILSILLMAYFFTKIYKNRAII